MADHRRALGAAGEEQAARWYAARGYEVVARNWRCREGEIDLVVARGRLLVVVEVKTRRTDRFGTPAEAVTPAKQRRLRHLALRYLDSTGARPEAVRFDVAAVLAGRLEVIEAAFLASGQPKRAHSTSSRQAMRAPATMAASRAGFLRRWWNGLRPMRPASHRRPLSGVTRAA
jgi:putative endonuclease